MTVDQEPVAVVDDDAAVRDSFRFLLESIDCPVETFASGDCLLKRMRSVPFRCLILDQHMPELTGLELARRVRGAGRVVPIMLISGALDADIVSQAALLGLQKIAEKPLTEPEIIEFIARAGADQTVVARFTGV